MVAKVEWHRGELYPRIGFVVTNLVRPAERIVAFYNHRGTCEQYINEGKGAIKVDAAVMPILCRQRGSPSAPCPGLQRMARPICKLRFTGMSDCRPRSTQPCAGTGERSADGHPGGS